MERKSYYLGGDVAYDATNTDIYGSSAITVTPDTVMGSGGNQIQDRMGKPGMVSPITGMPLPPGGFPAVPATRPGPNIPPPRNPGNPGGVFYPNNNGFNFRQEGDMGRYIADNDPGQQFAGFSSYQDYLNAGNDPVAGGNNNQMGILPVMPQLPGFRDDTNSKLDVPQGGMNFTEKSPDMSDEDIQKGFAEYIKQNPDIMSGPSTQAIVNLTLPGGTPISFRSGAGARALGQYLKSIGMEAGPGLDSIEAIDKIGGPKKLEPLSPLAATAYSKGGSVKRGIDYLMGM